ncbi:adenine phosphoribosyltransferase isoform X1 [Neoarius graeffei]|uniref:adenine phosphoribosyltransferase isoform X1 n=1 Tax=Neoarius graeffei TaxID=443677 RepID=UPI00298CDBEF|nr:adenine phosphoribosyltransferase isoform X1 [Neoarius graeffei]
MIIIIPSCHLFLLFPEQAFSDCVKELLKPFQSDSIDLVAGIDAMGFILGSAVATALGKGFLAIRKAGHLCVETQMQEYTDYSGREKLMEVRVDVLKPGLHVLIVDQWIETGGTMKAAIKLVEKQGASVVGAYSSRMSPFTGHDSHWCQECRRQMDVKAGREFIQANWQTNPNHKAKGVAAVAIENSEGGKWIKENYKYSHCIPKELQSQIDGRYLESFKDFNS